MTKRNPDDVEELIAACMAREAALKRVQERMDLEANWRFEKHMKMGEHHPDMMALERAEEQVRVVLRRFL